jgi:hypothetical protein
VDDTIFIVARAVPNGVGRGWLPVYTVNGHSHGDTYAATGYSKTEAESLALQFAQAEAARYIGDWNVIVAKEDAE